MWLQHLVLWKRLSWCLSSHMWDVLRSECCIKRRHFFSHVFFPICLGHSCGILMQQKYYYCVFMWYKAVRSKGGHQVFLSGSLKQHGHWWGIRPDGSLSSSDELPFNYYIGKFISECILERTHELYGNRYLNGHKTGAWTGLFAL